MAAVEVPAVEGAFDSPFSPDEMEPTLRPLGEATSLPARAYTDPDVFAYERDRWWASDWVCVGRASEVVESGSWFAAQVGAGRVVVIAGDDGVPRAFHNVCRHRGVTLLEGHGERAACIRCPYHAWTYDLRGRLVRTPVRGEADSLLPMEKDLRSVRLESFGGFLFASLDPVGQNLLDWLNDLPAQFDGIPLEDLVLGQRTETMVRANWKLLMENFAEAYHFGSVHPQLQRITPSHRAASLLSMGPWQGGWMPLRNGAETVSTDSRFHGRPLLRKRGVEAKGALDYVLFPNLFLSLQPDYLLAYRLSPISHEQTRVTLDVLFDRGTAKDGRVDAPDVYDFWRTTNAQDFAICERQQQGIATPGFVPGRYMPAEEGVHEFDKIVAQRYGEG